MKILFALPALLLLLSGCDKTAAPTSVTRPTATPAPGPPTAAPPTTTPAPGRPTSGTPAKSYSLDEARLRLLAINNLKLIGMGLETFHNQKGNFPPVDGTATYWFPKFAGMSWRAYILPFMESDRNKRADVKTVQAWMDGGFKGPNPVEKWNVPEIAAIRFDPFAHPAADKAGPPWLTPYRVFVGNGAAFEKGDAGAKVDDLMKDFKDGRENTLLVVEAAESVPWPKAAELEYDPAKPLPKLGLFSDGTYAVFADGKVRFIARDTPESSIRAWITRSGGEKVALPPVVDPDALYKAPGAK